MRLHAASAFSSWVKIKDCMWKSSILSFTPSLKQLWMTVYIYRIGYFVVCHKLSVKKKAGVFAVGLWVKKKSLMFLRMMNKSTKQSGNTSRWQQRLFVFSRAVITIPGTNQGAYQLRTCMNRFILMYMRRCKEWNISLYLPLVLGSQGAQLLDVAAMLLTSPWKALALGVSHLHV